MKMKRSQLKSFIYECYREFLIRRNDIVIMEDEAKDADMVFAEGGQLPTGTDQILAKFPTLKHALIRLHTEQWEDFVDGLEWVSPRPSVFRVKLKNGQDYTLKWLGQDFEAEISGKKYYIGQISGYQQALQKLSILYQEGPMGMDDEGGDKGGEGGEAPDFNGGGGGGSDFPGGEEDESEGEGSEGKEDEEGEDVGGEDIDFEADDSI